MRVLTILLIICIFFSTDIFSQKNESGDKKIKIYSISWNTAYKLARTTKNIKQKYIYYFETDVTWLDVMFLNYEDCIEKLSKQKVIASADSLSKAIRTNVLVELCFPNKRIVKVYFNNEGDFYFNGNWHKRNDGFYYLLFKYFSDEIIPPTTFQEAKKNYKDKLW
ncbi:MAG: hypothetical protein H0W73_05000 [Bacteroidetes bacterium]|nr:hypothetical protein [Bacteroidota bacterium]